MEDIDKVIKKVQCHECDLVEKVGGIIGGIGFKVGGGKDKIKAMRSSVPDGKLKGFKADEGSQMDALQRIARGINTLAGKKVVKVSAVKGAADFEERAKSIGGFLIEKAGGIGEEYIAIKKAIQERMSNLQSVLKIVSKFLAEFKLKELNVPEWRKFKLIVQDILKVGETELELLGKAVNLEMDKTIEIDDAIKRNTKLKAVIERHGVKMGTTGTGKLLALYLTGMIDIAQSAKVIGDYLKALGLTLNDYKKLNHLDLEKKALKNLGAGNKNLKELSKVLEAMKYITSKTVHKEKIIKKLEETSGGIGSYGKKVKHVLKVRKNALSSYSVQLKNIIQAIYAGVNKISSLAGKSIKYNKNFDEFVESFLALKDLDQEKNIKALLGYTTDDESKKMKDQYEKKIILAFEALNKINHAAAKEVADLLKEFQNITVSYAKTFKEYHGGTTADFKDFKKTTINLRYNKELSKLKSNLDRAAEELTTNLGDFDTVLRRSLDLKKEDLKKERKKVKKMAELHSGLEGSKKMGVGEYINYAFELKGKMWQVAQALEMYLKEFNVMKLNKYEDFSRLRELLEPIRILKDANGATAVMKLLEPEFTGDDYIAWATNPANQTVLAGEPLEMVDMNFEWSKWKSRIVGAYKPYSVLKNLVSLFMGIGDKIGLIELRKKTSLTVQQIWEYLGEFMFGTSVLLCQSEVFKTLEARMVSYERVEHVDDMWIDPLSNKLIIKNTLAAKYGITLPYIANTNLLMLGRMDGSELFGSKTYNAIWVTSAVAATAPVGLGAAYVAILGTENAYMPRPVLTIAANYTELTLVPDKVTKDLIKTHLNITQIDREVGDFLGTAAELFPTNFTHIKENYDYIYYKPEIQECLKSLLIVKRSFQFLPLTVQQSLLNPIIPPFNITVNAGALTLDEVKRMIGYIQISYHVLKINNLVWGQGVISASNRLWGITHHQFRYLRHAATNRVLKSLYNYFDKQIVIAKGAPGLGAAANGSLVASVSRYRTFMAAIDALNFDIYKTVSYDTTLMGTVNLHYQDNAGARQISSGANIGVLFTPALGALPLRGAPANPIGADLLSVLQSIFSLAGSAIPISEISIPDINIVTISKRMIYKTCPKALIGNYVLTPNRKNQQLKVMRAPAKNAIVDFSEESKLFRTCLKGIYSKVSSSIGIYELFNKPKLEQFKFNTDRIILGAGNPEILDNAVEFYIRLPLFIDAYKMLFIPADSDPNSNIEEHFKSAEKFRITFLPEMQGTIFGPIFNIMWRKVFGTTVYTDLDYKAIIGEVNILYQKKYKDSDINTCINDLVKEVNSRYGKIKAAEYQYFKEYVKTDIEYGPDAEKTILPGEDEGNLAGDVMINDMGFSEGLDKNFYDLSHTKGLVYDFMNRLYALLQTDDNGKEFNIDFRPFIESIEEECKMAKDQTMKYDVVVRGMRGIKRTTGASFSSDLMVHEFVSMPLTILDNVRKRIDDVLHNPAAIYDLAEVYKDLMAMPGYDAATDCRAGIAAIVAMPRIMAPLLRNIPAMDLKRPARFAGQSIYVTPFNVLTVGTGANTDVYDTYTGTIFSNAVAVSVAGARHTNASTPADMPKNIKTGVHLLNEIEVLGRVKWIESYSEMFKLIVDNSEFFEIREDSDSLMLDFSKLKDFVEKTLDYTKRYIDLLRSNKKIEGLEKKYNIIRTELLENYIRGKSIDKNITLQSLALKFSRNKETINKLVKDHSYIYNFNLLNDIPGSPRNNHTELSENKMNDLMIDSKTDNVWDMGSDDLQKSKNIYSSFNQLVVHVLNEFMDPVTKKIYGKLLDIIERDHNKDILSFNKGSGGTHLDIVDIKTYKTSCENFEWVDKVLKYLSGTDMKRGDKNSKIVNELDDLPINLKENIVSKLPHLIARFTALIKKVRMISLSSGRHSSYRGTICEVPDFDNGEHLVSWVANTNAAPTEFKRDLYTPALGGIPIFAKNPGHVIGTLTFEDIIDRSIPIYPKTILARTINIGAGILETNQSLFDRLNYISPSLTNALPLNGNLGNFRGIWDYITPLIADIGGVAGDLKALDAWSIANKQEVVDGTTCMAGTASRVGLAFTEYSKQLQLKKQKNFEHMLRDMGLTLQDDPYDNNNRQKLLEKLSIKNEVKRLESRIFNIICALTDIKTEIDEEPIFMELVPEFTQKYKSLNRLDPLMPISSSIILRKLPIFSKTGDIRKLIRGCRMVLSDMKETQLPWSKFLVTQYMKTSGKSDPGFLEIINNQNSLLSMLYIDGAFENRVDSQNTDIKLYQYDKLEREVLDLTESTNSNEQLIKMISDNDHKSDRLEAIRLNILDLNINPVNIHALYRQIPFLGLYTYAYNTEMHIFNFLNKRTPPPAAGGISGQLTRKPMKFNNQDIMDNFDLESELSTTDAVNTALGAITGLGREETLKNISVRLFKNCESSDTLKNDTNSLRVADYTYGLLMFKYNDKNTFAFSDSLAPYLLSRHDNAISTTSVTHRAIAGAVRFNTHRIGSTKAAVTKLYSNVDASAVVNAATQAAKDYLQNELASRLECDAMKYIYFNDTLYSSIMELLDTKLKAIEDTNTGILTSTSILSAKL
jgi:hypothetical protein